MEERAKPCHCLVTIYALVIDFFNFTKSFRQQFFDGLSFSQLQ